MKTCTSDMDPFEKWRSLWCVIPGDINPFIWIGSNTNNSPRPASAMIHEDTECWESWLKKTSLLTNHTVLLNRIKDAPCWHIGNFSILRTETHSSYWSRVTSNFSHSWCLSDLPDVTPPQLPSRFGSGASRLTGNKWLSSWLRLSEIAHHEWLLLLLLSRRPQVKEGVVEMDSLCHSPLERARLFEEMSRVWVRVSN